MSEDTEMNFEDKQKTELDMLKSRAKMMGIEHSNNIGVEALREKINAKMDAASDVVEEVVEPINPISDEPVRTNTQKKHSLRQQLQSEALKLVRLRITNLDPSKKDLKGEILSVSNDFVGNIRKFIPYGEATENGFHVPHILYKHMKRKQFQQIKTFRNKRTGQIEISQSMVREFALEVLDSLTKEEIRRLAASQSAAGGLD